MHPRQSSICQDDLTETVIQLNLELVEAWSGLDLDMDTHRSALDGMLVLKSQLEQSVRESEKFSIELDRSNASILQEENKCWGKSYTRSKRAGTRGYTGRISLQATWSKRNSG